MNVPGRRTPWEEGDGRARSTDREPGGVLTASPSLEPFELCILQPGFRELQSLAQGFTASQVEESPLEPSHVWFQNPASSPPSCLPGTFRVMVRLILAPLRCRSGASLRR